MDRMKIKTTSLRQREDNNFVPGTAVERISMVWPLTKEVASLSPKHDVERRLQKHVVGPKRRER
jgi:hypothetical protein